VLGDEALDRRRVHRHPVPRHDGTDRLEVVPPT
jgi:hypothetical protein